MSFVPLTGHFLLGAFGTPELFKTTHLTTKGKTMGDNLLPDEPLHLLFV